MRGKGRPFLLLSGILSILMAGGISAEAATIYVPDNYSTIQEAADAANPGDTIIVRDGTYSVNGILTIPENITLIIEPGVVIKVSGYYPQNSKIIINGTLKAIGTEEEKIVFTSAADSDYGGSGASPGSWGRIDFTETSTDSELENIILRYGGGFWDPGQDCSGDAAGIRVQGASIILKNSVLEHNKRSGLLLINSSSTIDNVQFLDTVPCQGYLTHGGNGISINGGVPSVKNSLFKKNVCGIVTGGLSSSSHIYLNNFIENTDHVYLWSSAGTWNSPEEIIYAYNGNTYTSYLGNYWDDYTGTDADGDGIGDTAYNIDGDQDNYPLMMPFENYSVEELPPQLYAVICGHDERGQLFGRDAEAIYDVLLEYPAVKTHNLRLVRSLDDLWTAIPGVVEKLQPGDQFWFYYSGHGEFGLDGTEPAVWNSPRVALLSGELKNEGDEYLSSKEGAVSDDVLTDWLSSNPKMKDVRKIIILDSCMSGGFWGREGNESDEGDLDKVQNVGLIAACDETHFAYSYPDWSWLGERRGRGMFSFVLEEQLRRGENGIPPADLNHDGAVSFDELSTAMRHAYTIERGATGIIRSFPWLEEDIEVEIDANEIPELNVNHGIDFDSNAPVIPKKRITDLDNDWDVDFADLTVLTSHWLEADCSSPTWCWGADLNRSGVVNFIDFGILAEDWLWAKIPADIDIDGDVDFVDYAVFANHWMNQNCAEPNWCEGTDFDHSGSVDMLDLATFARYWLEGI